MKNYKVRGIPDEQYKKLRNEAADNTKAEKAANSINKVILKAIKEYLKK